MAETVERRDPNKPASETTAGTSVLPCAQSNTKGDQPAKPIDTVKVTCSHYGRTPAAGITMFEVVPTAGIALPYTDKTSIVWNGPNMPEDISVTEFGDISGGATYNIPCNFERKQAEAQWRKDVADSSKSVVEGIKSRKITQVAAGALSATGYTLVELLKEMWTYNHYKDYAISDLPTGSLTIRTYNPERWTLSLKLPKLKKWESGAPLEKELSGDKNHKWWKPPITRTVNVTPGVGKVPNVGQNIYEEKNPENGASHEKKLIKQSTGDYITVTRDGSPLKMDALNSISALLRLVDIIYEIIELMQDVQEAVPKAGPSFEFDLSVMEGQFDLDWAWKEYKDHRAYFNIKPSISVNLLSGTAKLAFGIACPGFKAQAYLYASLEVPITIAFDNKEPGNIWKKTITAEGKISSTLQFAVGAEVQIGHVLNLKVEGIAGIKIEGGLKLAEEFSISAAVSFTGLKASFTTGVAAGGAYASKQTAKKIGRDSTWSVGGDTSSHTHVFFQEYDWGEWKWPDNRSETDDLPDSEFETIIEESLSGKTNHTYPLEFLSEKDESEKRWYTSDYVEIGSAQIARKIVSKASGRPIRRKKRALEGFAQQVRTELAIIEERGLLKDDFITQQRIDTYINGPELEAIINSNLDPIKLI